MITGIDEVGRGAVAGPIVAASFSIKKSYIYQLYHKFNDIATSNTLKPREQGYTERLVKILHHDKTKANAQGGEELDLNSIENLQKIYNLQDSKKMTANNRKLVLPILFKIGEFRIGLVSNELIDKLGITWANKQIFVRALKTIPKSVILSDYTTFNTSDQNEYIKLTKGDSKSFCIAAASVIAKEYRDYLMGVWHEKYPQYGFDKHVGYGTKYHMDRICEFGMCTIHRKSFLKAK